MNVRCAECSQLFSLTTHLWRCECGGVFELSERPPFNKDKIDPKASTLWRYRAMLPAIQPENIVSLGEGGTPIVPAQAYGISFLAKLEFLAPTGSFKDRGTTVLVSFLKELGVTEVVEDSSGNAAASLAAYCARAGIRCKIFVPAGASPAKLRQIRAYGADLVPVEGPRENAALAVQHAAQRSYYASHVYSPLILEGTKTLAYEIWEQLGGRAPDAMLFPTGHGTLLLGAYYGFRELRAAELIEKIPALHAVQAQACAPLYYIYTENLSELPDIPQGETIAEGIRIRRPVRWKALIQAIRETGGSVVTVSEDEILAAQRALAHQGLYLEPTSAVAVAGLRSPLVRPDDLVIIPLTGSGLKTPPLNPNGLP
ncbi:MAG: threonine synthase [Candidatus Bipolaricaulota bacterium]|nr:threonine synthase [Candidatus Bipolaricaulota bacterium]